MANKLLFTLERDYNDNIKVIANNHKDLEDYLRASYEWYKLEVLDDIVRVVEVQGFETIIGTIEWVKHI